MSANDETKVGADELPAGDDQVVVAGEERSSKKPPTPVTTLSDFFARKKTKPSSFLKGLGEVGIWNFDPADIEDALRSHAERDPDFARTTQLIAAAMKEKDRSRVRPVLSFAVQAVEQRLDSTPGMSDGALDAGGDPIERFDLVVQTLAPRMKAGAQRRKEAMNMLLATLLWLHHTARLDAAVGVERLLAAARVEPESSEERQRRRLVWLGERPKELSQVLDLLASTVSRSSRLAEALERAQADHRAEVLARTAADDDVVRLEGRVADLEAMLRERHADVTRLTEESRAATVHADLDVKQTTARLATTLEDALRELVLTVDEALSLDPPRVSVAQEKTQVLLRELDRQVTWLRS